MLFRSTDPLFWNKVTDFYKLSKQSGVPVYLITSSANSEVLAFLKTHQLTTMPTVVCDAIVLKTMIRSNPGLMLLKGAQVIKNWHYNDWPVFEHIRQNYLP